MKTICIAPLLILVAGCASTPLVGGGLQHIGNRQSLIDSNWRFHLGDVADGQSPTLDDGQWRIVQLPHDWSIEQPFDQKLASATAYLPGGVGWYRGHLAIAEPIDGWRVSIRFDGIYMNSHVWINGHDLGLRPNGFVSFQYDITDYLNPPGQPNTIAVRVDHTEDADSRFYTGSGIYRDVSLIVTRDLHVDPWGVYATTTRITSDSATVAIQTSVSNQGTKDHDVTVTSVLLGPADIARQTESTRSISAGQTLRFDQSCDVAHPRLWSCEQPNLYMLLTKVSVNGELVDRTATPIGIRSIQFDPDHGFLLNGQKTLIKGVCLHQDAGGFGAAVTEDVFAYRLKLLKEMGCNAIRTSHNPPSPLFLDLCDRMGFLVMDEAFDEWAKPKRKWLDGRNHGTPGSQGYSEYFDQWATADLRSMVERDRNHPSVILWSIGNEIDYEKDPYWNPYSATYQHGKPNALDLVPIAESLKATVKQFDLTRPVMTALANIAVSNRTGLADVLDVAGYNYEEQFYAADHAKYPHRAITGSENAHFYAQWSAVRTLPFVGGQFVWTGIDYLGESPGWPTHGAPAGDIDECGFKKPLFYFQQSLWSDKPMIYLAVRPQAGTNRFARGIQPIPSWSASTPGRTVGVVCYTNCQSAELFLNGKSLGIKRLADFPDHTLSWQVSYAPGTLQAIGRNGGNPICAAQLTTTGRPDHISLLSDRQTIDNNGRALAFVEADVVDSAGNTIYAADNSIHFDLNGPGSIAIIDSGDLASLEPFRADHRKAFHGQCLLVVRSQTKSGEIVIHASSEGLASGELTIHSGI
jgi:beta-galactosidase